MHSMFFGATSFDQDLSTWDVSSVTDMAYMFKQARNFNQSLSTWNVSNVTNMHSMFYSNIPSGSSSNFNQDISNWNVYPSSISQVTDLSYMFYIVNALGNFANNISDANKCAINLAFSGNTNWQYNTSPPPTYYQYWGVYCILGCMDSTALNYDPSAIIDDGSCFFVAVNGCTDSTALNYNTAANTDDGSCIGLGSTYQGGIIFYLDGNGGGLIAAPSDQSSGAGWGCNGTSISGANGTAIGTGNQNTIDIEAGCTTGGIAADICANYTDGTYSDWFLPSKDELNTMYLNIGQGNALGLGNIGGFAFVNYWSSSEYHIDHYGEQYFAWYQGFHDGGQVCYYKDYSGPFVRAVRAF